MSRLENRSPIFKLFTAGTHVPFWFQTARAPQPLTINSAAARFSVTVSKIFFYKATIIIGETETGTEFYAENTVLS